MALNIIDSAVKYLKSNLDDKFTAKQIAKWIVDNNQKDCKEKLERSKSSNTVEELIQQIAREIYAKNSTGNLLRNNIKSVEGPPKKFYYTEKADDDEVVEVKLEDDKGKSKISEESLYKKLSEFLQSIAIYSKRINEKKSKNSKGKDGNKWLYPDIVGLEDLSADWGQEVKDCASQYFDKKTKLWSFEVKISINRSDLRKNFFQAVSNSSWANFGYLVAVETQGYDTMKELRMLSSLHGIGFIQLNIDEPSDSQIIIPAKERKEIDWNNANRLAEENKDFREYIKVIRTFYQTGDIRLLMNDKSSFDLD